MKVLLSLDGATKSGGAPLVLHNERLADPLNEFSREIAKVSKKRNKTEADYREIARLEFLGGLYTDDKGEPAVPAFNIIRCLQNGAKRHKLGMYVLRGVVPLIQMVPLAYEGPRVPDEMYRCGRFMLRKSVGIGGNRTMRTRPIFTNWSAVLPVEVDATVFDPDTLKNVWHEAGIYAGLCEMRPIYGKFKAMMTEWKMSGDDRIGEACYALACAISARRIQIDDMYRDGRHGSIEDLLAAFASSAESIDRELAGFSTNGAKDS